MAITLQIINKLKIIKSQILNLLVSCLIIFNKIIRTAWVEFLYLFFYKLNVFVNHLFGSHNPMQNQPGNKITHFIPAKVILLSFIVLISFSFSSYGSTKTWAIPGSGGTWTGNWGGPDPVNGDDIVITPTANIVITNVPNGLTFNSITINGAFNVTFTSSGAVGMAINNTNATPALTIITGAALTLSNSGNIVSIEFISCTTATAISGTLACSAEGEIQVDAGATLTILSGGILSNIGPSFVVFGTLSNAGTVNTASGYLNIHGTVNNSGTINGAAGNLLFAPGSNYNHIQDGGTIPTATWFSTSNCNITGIISTPIAGGLNQTFGNMTVNCPGLTSPVTLTTSGNVSVAGSLSIQGTSAVNTLTFNPANYTISITGTTSINNYGILLLGYNGGVNTFGGLITLNGTGAWTSTSVNTAANLIIQSGITNAGTGAFNADAGTLNTACAISMNSTGNVTFGSSNGNLADNIATTIQGIGTGTFNFNGTGTMTLGNGVVVTNKTTANISGVLTGSNAASIWSNANGSTLNYSNGTTLFSTFGNLTANAPVNTVNYNGTGAQTIIPGTAGYSNLTVSIPAGGPGNAIKTTSAAIAIGNNLVIQSSDPVNTVTFNPSGFNLTVTGTTTINNNGIFNPTTNIGVNTFNNSITLNNSGSWTSTAVTTPGNMAVNAGMTLSANSTGTVNFGSGTISALTVNAGTFNDEVGVAAADFTLSGTTTVAGGTFNLVPTLAGSTSTFNGNISVSSGSFNISPAVAATFTTGAAITTTVSGGSFNITTNNCVSTFKGLITLSNSGAWTSTSCNTAANLIIQAGITISGTGNFNADAATLNTACTISLNSTGNVSFGSSNGNLADNVATTIQGIGTGTFNFNGTGTMTITGAIVVTNNITSNINGILNGTVTGFTWTNANGSTLNYANGTKMFNTAGTLTANANTNLVNYNGTAAQIIIPASAGYYNLSVTLPSGGPGNAIKTTSGNIAVGNNLIIQSSDPVNTVTFNPSGFNLTVTGTTTINNNGIFNPTTNVGVMTFNNPITLNNSGSWTSTAITTPGNMAVNQGMTLSANSTGTVNFGSGTISALTVNAGTFNDKLNIAAADFTVVGTTSIAGGTLNIVPTLAGSTSTFNNAITISSGSFNISPAVAATLTSAATTTLTISGGSFNVTNNNCATTIKGLVTVSSTGSWTSTAVTTLANMNINAGFTQSATSTGTVNFGAGTISALTVNGGTFNDALAVAAAAFTVSGVTAVGGGTLNVVPTVAGSTNTFSGNISVSSGSFNISPGVAATFTTGAGVTTSVSGGSFNITTNNCTCTFTGAVTLSGSGAWTSSSLNTPGNLTFKSNVINNGTGNFSADGATLTAAAPPTLVQVNSSGNVSFGSSNDNLNITTNTTISGAGPGTFNFNGTSTMTVTGAITVTNSTSSNIYGILNGTVAGYTWTNTANLGNLNYYNATKPMATGTFTVNNAGTTVNYAGTTQSITGVPYTNLTISGGGIKTLAGNASLTASGVLTLNSGVLELNGNSLQINNIAVGAITNSGILQFFQYDSY